MDTSPSHRYYLRRGSSVAALVLESGIVEGDNEAHNCDAEDVEKQDAIEYSSSRFWDLSRRAFCLGCGQDEDLRPNVGESRLDRLPGYRSKTLPIELSARSERERLDRYKEGRDHVLREPLREGDDEERE